MRAVYKFEIIEFSTDIMLPAGSRVLDFQYQDKKLFMWAEVNTRDENKHPLSVTIIGTGHEKNEKFFKNLTYFKTFQDGLFVWHIYLDDLHNKFLGINK